MASSSQTEQEDSYESEYIDKSRLRESDLDLQVYIFYLGVYASDSSLPNLPGNAWAIFLQIFPTESVSIRITRSTDGHGIVTLESLDDVYSCGLARVMRFDTVGQPTVRQLLRILIEKGRDKYLFGEWGRGQRHWFYTVLKDWEDEELLIEGSSERAKEMLEGYWYGELASYSMTIVAGTFTESVDDAGQDK